MSPAVPIMSFVVLCLAFSYHISLVPFDLWLLCCHFCFLVFYDMDIFEESRLVFSKKVSFDSCFSKCELASRFKSLTVILKSEGLLPVRSPECLAGSEGWPHETEHGLSWEAQLPLQPLFFPSSSVPMSGICKPSIKEWGLVCEHVWRPGGLRGPCPPMGGLPDLKEAGESAGGATPGPATKFAGPHAKGKCGVPASRAVRNL